MTSLKKWLRGISVNMSTIFDASLGDYRVQVLPAFGLRKWVRYHHWYLPFMNNDFVSLVAEVTRKDGKCTSESVQYSWMFKRLCDNKAFGSGEGSAKLGIPISIVSDLIWETDTYSLEFRLISGDVIYAKPEIMIIPVKDRADITLQYVLPLIISLITLLLSVALSILASIITARIVR